MKMQGIAEASNTLQFLFPVLPSPLPLLLESWPRAAMPVPGQVVRILFVLCEPKAESTLTYRWLKFTGTGRLSCRHFI